MYYDPLTRKKFMSKNAYDNAVNTNKYKELVRKSGVPPPPPILCTVNRQQPTAAAGGRACTMDISMLPGT